MSVIRRAPGFRSIPHTLAEAAARLRRRQSGSANWDRCV